MVAEHRMLIDGDRTASESGATSGVGRVGGRFSMERLTELKTVVVNMG